MTKSGRSSRNSSRNIHGQFYTGKQKLVDTARRVDKFQRRVELKATTAATRKGRAVKRTALRVKRAAKGPKAEEA
jgi:hypothetical protein